MTPDRTAFPIPGYCWYRSSGIDEALVIRTLRRAYQDFGGQDGPHLAETVRRHLSSRSKLWWVVPDAEGRASDLQGLAPVSLTPTDLNLTGLDPIGCLWLSEAVDQRNGESQAYVFLVYVAPEHRRRGIGTVLMQQAQQWASKNGYPSISLQVFEANHAALTLYKKLGYESQAVWLTKTLVD